MARLVADSKERVPCNNARAKKIWYQIARLSDETSATRYQLCLQYINNGLKWLIIMIMSIRVTAWRYIKETIDSGFVIYVHMLEAKNGFLKRMKYT